MTQRFPLITSNIHWAPEKAELGANRCRSCSLANWLEGLSVDFRYTNFRGEGYLFGDNVCPPWLIPLPRNTRNQAPPHHLRSSLCHPALTECNGRHAFCNGQGYSCKRDAGLKSDGDACSSAAPSWKVFRCDILKHWFCVTR